MDNTPSDSISPCSAPCERCGGCIDNADLRVLRELAADAIVQLTSIEALPVEVALVFLRADGVAVLAPESA